MLQVEGAFGVGGNCPFQSVYWIAVSQTGNPNGNWNVYAYDMSLGTQNAADYTQIGFDQRAIYFSGNMFDLSGNNFQYQEIFGVNKARLEKHASSAAFGFTHLTISGSTSVLVDTVQPVETEMHSYGGPSGGLFVNSFNINGDPFGDNCSSTACHGLSIWAIANPGMSSDSLSSVFVDTAPYTMAPNADQPSCNQCVESLDTRITGTPPYHNGLISFALETAVNNGAQVVPAIYWGQVAPQLDPNGALTGALLFQQGNFYFTTGDTAASFGALMPDSDGDLFMVFEKMSNSINPEVDYTARRVWFTLGQFADGGITLRKGDAPTGDYRWGDYEATSFSGFASDTVWFAGEYSNGDWATYIGSDKFCVGCNY